MLPNLGTPELIVVLVLVLVLFGAGRLPEVGRALGQTIRELRASLSDDPQTSERRGGG